MPGRLSFPSVPGPPFSVEPRRLRTGLLVVAELVFAGFVVGFGIGSAAPSSHRDVVVPASARAERAAPGAPARLDPAPGLPELIVPPPPVHVVKRAHHRRRRVTRTTAAATTVPAPAARPPVQQPTTTSPPPAPAPRPAPAPKPAPVQTFDSSG